MINKIAPSIAAALADVKDGSTVMIGGFGTAGIPNELIDELYRSCKLELELLPTDWGQIPVGVGVIC